MTKKHEDNSDEKTFIESIREGGEYAMVEHNINTGRTAIFATENMMDADKLRPVLDLVMDASERYKKEQVWWDKERLEVERDLLRDGLDKCDKQLKEKKRKEKKHGVSEVS